MSNKSSELPQEFLPTFAPAFLEDHARKLVTDPKIAVVEIVANSWDAGADTVKIQWPEDLVPEIIEFEDNGTGMTYDQFKRIWVELNYNRSTAQGDNVIFPEGNRRSSRTAFGRNGKGRHSMFCFSDYYNVETWCNGVSNTFKVSKQTSIAQVPFLIELVSKNEKEGHGTRIWTVIGKNHLTVNNIRDLIGSKFIADPSFEIILNGVSIELSNLDHLVETDILEIDEVGEVKVSLVDTEQTSRTSHPHGIAWWVNNRLVGEISWDSLKKEYDLDRRTIEAKKFTFVVQADCLVNDVLEDWSGFRENDRFEAVKNRVEKNIWDRILESLEDVHRLQKSSILKEKTEIISPLPIDSRFRISQIMDGIQDKIPTVQSKVLSATVDVLVNLEESRSGYRLLEQLSELDPSEIDKLSQILDSWSVHEAMVVLGELERRLKIIIKLEEIIDDPSIDELHEIHPLFHNGLWIFGPEYESVHFTSNQSLSTVLRDCFGDKELPSNLAKRRRPDFVVLPDSIIGVYSRESYDENSEVDGYDKVLIVELKKGGAEVRLKERRQGEDYAKEIRKSGKIRPSTDITVLVLGSRIHQDVIEPLKDGHTIVKARSYDVVLAQAHARTFKLLERIREVRKDIPTEDETISIISS